MCIYCGTAKYRKIYQQHYGDIPKEENGHTYDIHHIDGDRTNNVPENLVALTIQEHYDIHYSQGDYGAAWLIAKKINMSPEELSNISRLSALKQIKNGTNAFAKSGSEHTRYDHKVYHLVNKNGDEFIGTQYEFRIKFDLYQGSVSSVINGLIPSYKGWRLFGSALPIMGQPPDIKIYTLINDDGRIFSGDKRDIRKETGVSSGKLSKIINNEIGFKSYKGWRILSK